MTRRNTELPAPTIGILTALPKECAAVLAMLDNEGPAHCDGFYVGEISSTHGVHRVALGLLFDMGNNSAAIAAGRMLREFPTVQDIIMCGIAGGVLEREDAERDIRLGDIVVSDRGGVVQYDLVKEPPDGVKEHRHPPRPPSARLLQAARHLRVEEELGRRPWEALLPLGEKITKGRRPPDNLDARGVATEYPADPERRAGLPRVFHGTIAAANTLLKNSQYRDYLRKAFGVKCVEMEGSGIADATWADGAGYLVVRGICDYCDEHKGDHWQGAAAVAAAAYVRALIASMRPTPLDALPAERPGHHAAAVPATSATSTIGNITAGAGATMQVTVHTTSAPDTSNRDDRRSEEPGNSSPKTKPPSPRLPMKHTILFLAANPLGTDRLELEREARDIQAELERSGFRDRFEFETRWAAQPLDLLRELRKLKPTVVHFSGHGGPDAAAEHLPGPSPRRDVTGGLNHPSSRPQHGLYFQGPDGRPQLVSTEALEATFAAAGASVRLVALNACYSDVQAKALVSHVGCVVGMNGSIRDDAARSFAIGFYGGLGEGESIDAAYKQGCAAISLQGSLDHDRPQLTVRPGVDATKLVLAADSIEPSANRADSVPAPQPSGPGASLTAPPKVDIGILTMNRMEFLGWAAQLLGVNHTGGRFYVTMTRRGLSLGIDAEDTGRMRVHLFSNIDLQVAWMQSLAATPGPMPIVARPLFRQGATGGNRYYYGFTWLHAGGSYVSEQPVVSAFVQFLGAIALQRGISFT